MHEAMGIIGMGYLRSNGLVITIERQVGIEEPALVPPEEL